MMSHPALGTVLKGVAAKWGLFHQPGWVRLLGHFVVVAARDPLRGFCLRLGFLTVFPVWQA